MIYFSYTDFILTETAMWDSEIQNLITLIYRNTCYLINFCFTLFLSVKKKSKLLGAESRKSS